MPGSTWDVNTPGVMQLPSGRLIRGRGLRHPATNGPPPELGVYLQGREPARFEWDSRWVRWWDFWLPSDQQAFAGVLREVLQRCTVERVEISCSGGLGRTGTALACLVALDGLPGQYVVDYVRRNYSHRAVETPWQRRSATRFVAPSPPL